MRNDLFGLPAFLFAVLMLFYAWGPRDLDHDVDAVVEAPDAESRRAAAMRLFPERSEPSLEAGALVEAVFRCALWRWFGVLFWFLLLGAVGALLYRLVALCAQGEARKRLPEGPAQAATVLLAVLDWPVAQLMTLAMALVGNFDSVLGAWKDGGGASLKPDIGFLAAAARASVKVELAEEAMEDALDAGGTEFEWQRWHGAGCGYAGPAGTARCDEPGVAHPAVVAGGAGVVCDCGLGDLTRLARHPCEDSVTLLQAQASAVGG